MTDKNQPSPKKNDFGFNGIVGRDQALQQVFLRLKKVIPTHATVLILGESGTGKELIAEAIHESSYRGKNPFVKVNCAVLNDSLIESELFGHEEGSFTNASTLRKGRFELAHTGSIFLDEVGELSLRAQAKLLRVLQERELERVGGSETIKIDIRTIAATNQPLEALVKQDKFRRDLYYRLNMFQIVLPALRDRKEDILLLADHFLEQFTLEYNKPFKGFDKSAKDWLTSQLWPGNVRELKNTILSAAILCDTDLITESDLAQTHTDPLNEPAPKITITPPFLSEEDLLREYAQLVYRKSDFNKTKTAQILNVSFKTLQARLGASAKEHH